jgi:hypothetical protein
MTITVLTGLDSAQRSTLERLVIRARALLEDDLAVQAEGRFGIHLNGTIEDEAALPDATTDKITRRDLEQIVAHLRTQGEEPRGAVARLLREAAFTHLNRLIAIRIAEAIGLLPESLAHGRQSHGFRDFGEIMPMLADDYRAYVRLCGDELAADAPALFDPRNPLLELEPTTAAFDELVALVADSDAADIWTASDTLGWAYQFFNTAGERKEMRKSKAPRNSHELAVRNQFFTPRYVVDFLVQNTLGRRLLESDPTSELRDEMLLLVDPPSLRGPALDLEEVKCLDPACGSGHFLLGCYDLLERAWMMAGVAPADSAPRIVSALWGVDIDARCAQVASAAIVLRARRHCRDLPLPRPNIVTARGLPGGAAALPPDLQLTAAQRSLIDRVSGVLADAPLLGVLLKAEDALDEEIRHGLFGGMAGSKPGILELTDEAAEATERELLGHLQTIADQASSSVVERLLAAEADDALRLVDVVRQRYDAVLMNPPFGEPVSTTKPYLRAAYPWLPSTSDIFAAFVGRGLELCKPDGYMGAITSRVGLFLIGFEQWRRQVLLGHQLITLADLGEGVMEQAMVEAAAYVISPRQPPRDSAARFLRVVTATDPSSALTEAINEPDSAASFEVKLRAFDVIPGAPMAYWVDTATVASLLTPAPFEPSRGKVRVGLQTGDDFRFVRAWWEVAAHKLTRPPDEVAGRTEREQLATGARWAPIVKSGASQPWFSPVVLVVDWERDGERLKNFTDATGKRKSRPQNTDVYFLPGFSWTRRATRLVPYVVPAGCIPSVSRYQAFPFGDPYAAVGIVASNIATAYCRFYGEKFLWPNFLVENLKSLPIAQFDPSLEDAVRNAVSLGVNERRAHFAHREPFREFVGPGTSDSTPPTWDRRSLLGPDLDRRIAARYGLSEYQFERLDLDLQQALEVLGASVTDQDSEAEGDEAVSAESPYGQRLVSYLLGVAVGRWDVLVGRASTTARRLGDPFDPMSASPPGMLVGGDGLPSRESPENYPLALPSDHVLVDEPGHPWDVEAAVLRAAEIYLQESDVATYLAPVIGRKALRDYLRKQFFRDHLATYSAGARKAPIYWPLTVPSKSWGVWVYAPMFTRETLYAIGSEAGRRERLASDSIARLQREQREGGAGRSARQVAEELEGEEKLTEELRRFRIEAERVAGLGWEPDLDDGIVLCAAPLADLFPAWPEAKTARAELRKGRYEWATVAAWADQI